MGKIIMSTNQVGLTLRLLSTVYVVRVYKQLQEDIPFDWFETPTSFC